MNDKLVSFIAEHRPLLKSGSQLEVEFRYKAEPKTIKQFLVEYRSTFVDTCEITKTVDLIHSSPDISKPNYIKTRNAATDELTNHTKHRLIREVRDFYAIGISREETLQSEIKNTTAYSSKIVRIKLRLSIPLDTGRFDITQIAQIDDPGQMTPTIIKSAKSNIFDRIGDKESAAKKYDQFINNFGNPSITAIEMEYEFASDFDFKPFHFTPEYALALVGDNIGVILGQFRILKTVASVVEPGKKVYSLKGLLNNAASITKNDYNAIYPPVDWYITPKADGYSSLLILNMNEKHYIYSEYVSLAITTDAEISYKELTVLVGELLPVKDGNYRFLCYDMIIENRDSLADLQFKERLTKFARLLDGKIEFATSVGEKVLAEAKEHILITNDVQASLRMVSELNVDYEIDGYILVSPNQSYQATKNYKIKDHHTIDFLVVEVPNDMKKKNFLYNGENTFLLFCSIHPTELEKIMINKIPEYTKLFPRIDQFGNSPIPIQFSPIDDPLAYIWHPDKKLADKLREESRHGRLLCELEYLPETASWKFIKFRSDRRNEPNYFGNNLLKTAEIEWLISKYPLRLQDMHMPVSTYFEKSKSDLYYAQTGAMRFIIFVIMDSITKMSKNGSRFAIDLASGRGQDLAKYHTLGYTKLICCDIDSTALAELVSRRFAMIRNVKKNYKMNIKILHRDLNEPADDTIQLFQPIIENQPVGLIVCNLAIHYMINTPERLTNFVKLIRGLSAIGTHFMFTCMSGQAVLDLLGNSNEWIYHEKNILKYHIIKQFKESKLADHGQVIKTKLPFSNDLYEESLVNLEHVQNVFVKFGFNLASTGSMADFLPELNRKNTNTYAMLSEQDKQYIGLYHFTILVRAK